MYDSESRGNRLLDRSRLTPDLQRLVLIGAGNSLDFERVRDSLNFQFPDFKPSPPVAGSQGSSGKSKGKGSNASSSSLSSSTASNSSSFSPSSSSSYRSPSQGKYPRRVYQTGHGDELQQIPEESADQGQDHVSEGPHFEDAVEDAYEEDPAGDETSHDQEADFDEEDDDGSSLQDLANVLTVTSRKLQSTVLGRKFSGRPRSIEERKRTSACTACGQMGHWAGDSACNMSNKDKGPSKPNSKGAGKASLGKDGGKGKGIKKAFVVNLPGEDHLCQSTSSSSSSWNPTSTTSSPIGDPSTYFTFAINMHQIDHDPYHSYITEIIDFAGYMIIDTACQRSCCSSRWLDVHNRMLSNYHLKSHIVQSSDNFQFGSGGIHRALQRAYVPAALPGQPEDGLILGISVVPDAQIPFLASSSMLEKLGCIIDTVQKRLHFRFLGS